MNRRGFLSLFFCFVGGLEANFFFFCYGPYRVKHTSAFSQEKQHYTHYALRTASIVTLLRYFMHYLLEKWFTLGTYTSLWEAVDFWASAGTAGVMVTAAVALELWNCALPKERINVMQISQTWTQVTKKMKVGQNCSDVVSQTCLNHSIISNNTLHTMCYNTYCISKASIWTVILFWNVY